MEEKKSKILRGQIPTSVFYILFGLCLALMPVETVNVLCKVVFGLVLIGAGVYHILIFVLEKDNSTILDLFSGVIVLVIGIFLFMNPTVVVKLLTLMLGAFILVDSIWMLRGSLKLKKRIVGTWKAFLAAALLFVALGVLILINPFSQLKVTMQVAGWIFVINGVVDIIFYFLLSHGMKKEIPEKEEKKETDKSYKSYEEAEAEIYCRCHQQRLHDNKGCTLDCVYSRHDILYTNGVGDCRLLDDNNKLISADSIYLPIFIKAVLHALQCYLWLLHRFSKSFSFSNKKL